MNLKPIKANMTELHLMDIPEHGTVVLFSYETPVAAYTLKDGWVKTDQYYSRTTTKHINQWAGKAANSRPQEFFNELVK